MQPIRAENIIGEIIQEPWNEVGDNIYGVDFENSWTNFDSNRKVRFFKDTLGIVHIDGIASAGAVGTTIFTLPEKYRPDNAGDKLHFPVTSNDAFGQVLINVDGSVTSNVGAAAWTSLSGITFRAA
jgi:phosphomevalonate kinase